MINQVHLYCYWTHIYIHQQLSIYNFGVPRYEICIAPCPTLEALGWVIRSWRNRNPVSERQMTDARWTTGAWRNRTQFNISPCIRCSLLKSPFVISDIPDRQTHGLRCVHRQMHDVARRIKFVQICSNLMVTHNYVNYLRRMCVWLGFTSMCCINGTLLPHPHSALSLRFSSQITRIKDLGQNAHFACFGGMGNSMGNT